MLINTFCSEKYTTIDLSDYLRFLRVLYIFRLIFQKCFVLNFARFVFCRIVSLSCIISLIEKAGS